MRDTSNACITVINARSLLIQSSVQSVSNDMQWKITKQLTLPLEFEAY